MPNYCSYRIIVGGRKDNVDEFIRILQNDYDKTHMYRVFEAIPQYEDTYGLYKRADIVGDVAWSVYCGMLPGPLSYYSDDLKRHQNNEIIDVWNSRTRETEKYEATMENFKGTNLLELADRLSLTIYAYAVEPAMCFAEEYRILPGGIKVIDREGSYNEYWLEENQHSDNTYDSFKEYCDYWGYNPDDLPFDEEEYNFMMENGYASYENAEFDCNEDAIPDKPKYLAKNVLYKLVNKNNKGD